VRWTAEEEDGWEPLELVLKRHRARRARRQADHAEAEARRAETTEAEALPPDEVDE
jgi:hypothetical protein